MKFLSPLLAVFLAPLLVAQSLTIDLRLVDSSPSSGNGITVEVADQDAHPVANAAVVFRFPEGSSQATFADGSSSLVAYTDVNGRAQVEGIRWGSAAAAIPLKITAVKGIAHAGLLSELKPPVRPAPAVEPPRAIATEREHAPVTAPARPVPGALPTITDDDSPDANVPLRHTLTNDAAEGLAPSVSITSTGRPGASHGKTKWIIALAVAAGAGAALALAHKGASTSSSSSSGVSIGAPTVSVGHP